MPETRRQRCHSTIGRDESEVRGADRTAPERNSPAAATSSTPQPSVIKVQPAVVKEPPLCVGTAFDHARPGHRGNEADQRQVDRHVEKQQSPRRERRCHAQADCSGERDVKGDHPIGIARPAQEAQHAKRGGQHHAEHAEDVEGAAAHHVAHGDVALAAQGGDNRRGDFRLLYQRSRRWQVVNESWPVRGGASPSAAVDSGTSKERAGPLRKPG